MQLDAFGEYVRLRLENWGSVFALGRDCEYLGHQSKNMLQVLIEHKGEMPERVQGFKPLEVNQEAMQIELVVAEIARQNLTTACVLRAYYCGNGRRKIERWETANLLLSNMGLGVMRQRQYLTVAAIGTDDVGMAIRQQRMAG